MQADDPKSAAGSAPVARPRAASAPDRSPFEPACMRHAQLGQALQNVGIIERFERRIATARPARATTGFSPGRRRDGRCAARPDFPGPSDRPGRERHSSTKISLNDRVLSSVQSCIALMSASREMKSICRATMPSSKFRSEERPFMDRSPDRGSCAFCVAATRWRGIIAIIIRQRSGRSHELSGSRRTVEIGSVP